MFFIMGVSSAEKKLDFSQLCVCKRCGQYGRYEIIMTYTVFTFFFIPLFKWGRRYFVRETSCGARCEIDPQLGRGIERGEVTQLREDDLPFAPARAQDAPRRCEHCGFETDQRYEFCPMCGQRLS